MLPRQLVEHGVPTNELLKLEKITKTKSKTNK